ncbi:MAG: hypothetical protein GY737_25135 [Desulfobacteraceae bacterium]|nr:hypothetical protein [Desulfobacteraceae bacterium]
MDNRSDDFDDQGTMRHAVGSPELQDEIAHDSETDDQSTSPSVNDEHKDSSDEEEEEEQEQQDDTAAEDGDESSIWAELLERVYESMSFPEQGATADDVLSSKRYHKQILSELRDETEKIVRLGEFLQNQSEVYEKLRKTKDKLIDEEDYEMDEAIIAAWKNRKHLLSDILEEHKDVLQEHLTPDEDEGINQ